MGKLEKQQKKLETMQAKEELRLEKKHRKEAKKQEKKNKKKGKKSKNPGEKAKPVVDVSNIVGKAEREIRHDEEIDFNPKNVRWKKVLAVILWLIIAFFVFRGFVSVMNHENSDDIKKNMKEYYTELAGKEEIRTRAGSFTANFLNDYYRFDTNNNNWSDRIQRYLANGIIMEEPDGIDSETCESVEIRDISVDGEHIDVTASVIVSYTITVDSFEEETKQAIKEARLKYLVKVPVKTDGTNFAILSEPVYIADYNRAKSIENDSFEKSSAGTLTDGQENALRKTAENFFSAYYGKKTSALKNYVTQNFNSSAVAGSNLKFVEIKAFDGTKVKGGYRVRAEIVVNNSVLDMTETVYLKIVKGDQELFYVDELTIR